MKTATFKSLALISGERINVLMTDAENNIAVVKKCRYIAFNDEKQEIECVQTTRQEQISIPLDQIMVIVRFNQFAPMQKR